MGWTAVEKRPLLLLALLALMAFVPGIFSLPPVDRDEARFAQASKQMLESGNFVDIRFQTVPRHKKPVGIYWLQAGAASLFSSAPHTQIWAYRLPSIMGAIAAVLLTFWAGAPVFGKRTAFMSAGLLACTIMLGVEARLAKTDAVLLAAVVLAQAVLSRAYLARSTPFPLPLALLFWVAQGVGILIKGPIAPLISGLTILALRMADRQAHWLKALRPAWGLPLLALIVAPWAIAIGFATHGQFFNEALAGDMGSKLAGGQETHGAPPGYYVVAAILAFWPGTLVLLPALAYAIRNRADPAIRFLLAWAIPAWLFFEIVPTKLPHYVLPVYPALALLCGAALLSGSKDGAALTRGRVAFLASAGFIGGALGLALLLGGISRLADGSYALVHVMSGVAVAALAITAVVWLWRGQCVRAVVMAGLASVLVTSSALGLIAPSLTAPWVASRLIAMLPRSPQGDLPPLIVSGYSEPSLVFAAGTGTMIATPAEAASALAVMSNPDATAAIAEPSRRDFLTAAAQLNLTFTPIGEVAGYNYSIGKPVKLILYKARP